MAIVLNKSISQIRLFSISAPDSPLIYSEIFFLKVLSIHNTFRILSSIILNEIIK